MWCKSNSNVYKWIQYMTQIALHFNQLKFCNFSRGICTVTRLNTTWQMWIETHMLCVAHSLTSLPGSPEGPVSPGGPTGPGGPRSPLPPGAPCFPGSPWEERREEYSLLYYLIQSDIPVNHHTEQPGLDHLTHWLIYPDRLIILSKSKSDIVDK